MSVPIRLRPARESDVPALVELEHEAFRGDRLAERQFVTHARGGANSVFIVATRGAELVGNVLVFFRRGTARARLYSIAVAKSVRGLGVGAKLLTRAEREARVRGMRELVLEVRADNPVAIALYESRGYRRFGRRTGYYFDHCDALRFVKAL